MRARNFQTPALLAKPNLLCSVDKMGAIVELGRIGHLLGRKDSSKTYQLGFSQQETEMKT